MNMGGFVMIQGFKVKREGNQDFTVYFDLVVTLRDVLSFILQFLPIVVLVLHANIAVLQFFLNCTPTK